MGPVRLLAMALAVTLWAPSVLAFEETKIGVGAGNPAAGAPVLEIPKSTGSGGKELNLSGTGLSLGKTPGTEVRIPGLGTVGVLPKLDFGLELLYGASEPKGLPEDKADPDDVQIRGTAKYRF
jgi:hypothetical protein